MTVRSLPRWLMLTLVACACPSKQGPGAGSGSTGSGGPAVAGCDGIRGKVEQLYRTEAEATEPGRVAEAVADHTTMVMNDCAKAPDTVVACVNRAASVTELEQRCLAPLDDEGSEGEGLRK